MSQPTNKAAGAKKSAATGAAGLSNGFNWKQLLKHNDVLLAVGVVFIVVMMLIPLPSPVLDMLITLNIALSVTMLLVTIYTHEPLEYSTFPTILLVSTLFRLGLNISSARLILLNGNAGQVIHAFGSFVIGGNFVVGILLFIIIIIINFIVITNGAGRVSEVAARFTLDAMPGKQLAIDADLNAGLIDDKQAKHRRQQIQREADFYGTMDGASKFVKGDAIAAIIITVVNIVGGLVIGVIQRGMPLQEAAALYSIQTVGDGLVSQLPALIISSATGILVTRVTDKESSLGEDIGMQMFDNPKILAIMGSLMTLLGVVPGMPTLPFLLIGGAGIAGSFLVNKEHVNKATQEAEAQQQEKINQKKRTTTENVMDLLPVETLELEIGYRLVPLIEPDAGGDLLERIAQIRKQVALELGFVLPPVRVRDNLQLPPNQYTVKLRGIAIETGEVMADMWLAMNTDPENTEDLPGIQTKEPAFGLPALWIRADQKEDADLFGYTVVSASAVVATHLTEVIKRYAPEILSRSDVQSLLDNLKKTHEPLVADLIPDHLTVAEVHTILQNLLAEKVSIRNLVSILEALSYHYRVNKDIDFLTDQCRMALSRAICKQHANPATGQLCVLTLAPETEETIAQGLSPEGLALSPVFTQNLFAVLNQQLEQVVNEHGLQPVILCNARLRLPFRRLVERALPQIAIMSYNEIGPTIQVKSLGVVRADAQKQPSGVNNRMTV